MLTKTDRGSNLQCINCHAVVVPAILSNWPAHFGVQYPPKNLVYQYKHTCSNGKCIDSTWGDENETVNGIRLGDLTSLIALQYILAAINKPIANSIPAGTTNVTYNKTANMGFNVTKNFIIEDLSQTPNTPNTPNTTKCECGGHKIGIKKGSIGHSNWCSWFSA
jgi:hypothetical protein